MLRTDALDPKLQDHYRLKQALQLIQDQDNVIASLTTDLERARSTIYEQRTAMREVINQTSKIHQTLSNSQRPFLLG